VKLGRGETGHVFVDVDGTLLIWPTRPGSPRPGETPSVNRPLVDALKRWTATGGRVVIWTMGGIAHAEMARELCALDAAVCMAKPDIVVDDGDVLRKMPFASPAAFVGMVPA
jgi:hypothetical protein